MDEGLQSFFTAGFLNHLDPLPILQYAIEPKEDGEASDSEDDMDAGQGMRLRPELLPSDRQAWPAIAHNTTSESFKISVSYWAKILVLLDAADPDPHFTSLRHFFDARLAKPSEPPSSSLQSDRTFKDTSMQENDHSSNFVTRRSSYATSARMPKRFQWNRRPSLPSSMQLRPADNDTASVPRSFLGSLRRTSRQGASNTNGGLSITDGHELWIKSHDDASLQCIEFNVRLDLHNVHLAPPPPGAKAARTRPTAPSQTVTQGAREDASNAAAFSPRATSFTSEDVYASQSKSSSSRRSFISRILDRGLRKPSHTGRPAANSQPWSQNENESYHPYHPDNAEAIDSDEEMDRRESDHSRYPSSVHRRYSAGSNATRSHVGQYVPSDLERVEEDSLMVSTDQNSGNLHSTTMDSKATPGTENSDINDICEGEDFLTLLRKGSACVLQPGAQRNEPKWNRGADDALPSILTYAMARAFGWEGVMHLCYGADSLCAQEQVFTPLGRAADMDMNRKKKYDAVLSWRRNIPHGQGADEDYILSDQETTIPRHGDDTDSLVSGQSFDDHGPMPLEQGEDSDSCLTRNGLTRTWDDWYKLFMSIFGWVSEYETTRVRHGLAHEMGRETLSDLQNMTSTKKRGNTKVPLCVESDALHTSHGFQRFPGIPEALRLTADGQEHRDFRWARSRLSVNHIHTPISTYPFNPVFSCASMHFFMHQLSRSRWVFESGWELDYLNKCIFKSTMLQERFPSPGAQVVPPLHTYQPKSGELDISVPCPYPSTSGAWSALAWKSWLTTLREGHVIVPVVSWQAWWTLISVLNGADRSGRWYNLQVKEPNDTFDGLDLSSVYI